MQTEAQLSAAWRGRDRQYGERKTFGASALTPDEIERIMWWRQREAESLPELQRVRALAKLALWTPPRGRGA